MQGADEAAADGHESPSDTSEDANEEDVDADGGNVETIEAEDKRERYNALASYEEREKRGFELVYCNKGTFHVARGNAAMFQNCAELSDGTSRARYHVIPETVKSVDDNGTRIEPTIHVCSACKRGRRRAFDMAPARTIAAGCDFGRLSVVAPDAVTGESQKFDFNDVSDLEALLFATVRSYQIIAKLVVRQRDARRAHLQGNVISFEQTAESTASSFSCRYDKAAVEAALKHVKIYVVGTAKGKQGIIERKALQLIDLRLRPECVFNWHQILSQVPDERHLDPARRYSRAHPMTWTEFKKLYGEAYGSDKLETVPDLGERDQEQEQEQGQEQEEEQKQEQEQQQGQDDDVLGEKLAIALEGGLAEEGDRERQAVLKEVIAQGQPLHEFLEKPGLKMLVERLKALRK